MSIRKIEAIAYFCATCYNTRQKATSPAPSRAVVPVVRGASRPEAVGVILPIADIPSGSIRQASDDWHAVLRIQGAQHHLWLKEAPQLGAYAAELPLGADFDVRAHASHRLWRAIKGRPPGPLFINYPHSGANG